MTARGLLAIRKKRGAARLTPFLALAWGGFVPHSDFRTAHPLCIHATVLLRLLPETELLVCLTATAQREQQSCLTREAEGEDAVCGDFPRKFLQKTPAPA